MRKISVILLLLCLVLSSVGASAYTIENYSYSITGRTQERLVRRLVEPSSEGNEEFVSLENLVEALDKKKQVLLNTRVFTSVSYDYTLSENGEDSFGVQVHFDLKGSKTFLVIPYGKYDTNVGTRIGARFWESNVLGTFSELAGVVHVTFPDGAWDRPEVYAQVGITDLIVGDNTKVNLSLSADEQDGAWRSLSFALSLKNIPLWKYNLLFSNRIVSYEDGFYYGFGSELTGIQVKEVSLTPAVDILLYDEKTGLETSSYITPSIAMSGFSIGKLQIAQKDSIKFTKDGLQADGSYAYTPYVYTVDTLLSSDGYLEDFTYNNVFQYYPDTTKYYRHVGVAAHSYQYNVNNTVGFQLSENTKLHVYENLYFGTDNSLLWCDTGLGITQKIAITNQFVVAPTLGEYLRYNIASADWERFITLSADVSGNYINWDGNFRKGYSYSLSLHETWWQDFSKRYIGTDGVYDHFEVTYFTILGKWLNPSFRAIVNYANNTDYQYIKYTSETEVGEYLRGIRNVTIPNKKNMFSTVINLNLTSKFPMPHLFDWVDCYANVFFDYGAVKHGEGTDDLNRNQNYYGAGLEGIGIMKNYPSHPIRVSLGFDLEKLRKYLKEDGARDFYEIYIGMGFFF